MLEEQNTHHTGSDHPTCQHDTCKHRNSAVVVAGDMYHRSDKGSTYKDQPLQHNSYKLPTNAVIVDVSM